MAPFGPGSLRLCSLPERCTASAMAIVFGTTFNTAAMMPTETAEIALTRLRRIAFRFTVSPSLNIK